MASQKTKSIERVRRRMTEQERAEMLQAKQEILEELPEILAAVNESEASRTVRTRLTEEMHQALLDYCDQKGVDLSTVIRNAALSQIGRQDLIGTMPGRGRPR